ncbi:multidrug transporter [Paracoccus sp. YIM 132242]|uniref:Multidrug transporter n=1 Tax=Paracoccus lichenicola TaxID=2665644 RepID=A0A6L6HKW6_9RHOB|nr:multidrug transporter [Paracoccus lichenicola]MTD99826.1 multidrug transporter [Paracoccus lichenicola]
MNRIGQSPVPARAVGQTTRSIRIARIDAVMGGIFLLVLLLSLLGTALTYSSANPALQRIAALFLFEEERNLPTLFNFTLLVANMVALGTVAVFAFGGNDRWRWHWLFLALFFLFLAYDEAAQVHEGLNRVMDGVVDASGFLAFAWVVPGIAVVLAIGLAFGRFLLALPGRSARGFLLAGVLYVGGAIGVEMIGANLWWSHGWDNVAYSLLATLEETLEMTGLIVLLHATLGVLSGPGGSLRFEVRRGGGGDV